MSCYSVSCEQPETFNFYVFSREKSFPNHRRSDALVWRPD